MLYSVALANSLFYNFQKKTAIPSIIEKINQKSLLCEKEIFYHLETTLLESKQYTIVDMIMKQIF